MSPAGAFGFLQRVLRALQIGTSCVVPEGFADPHIQQLVFRSCWTSQSPGEIKKNKIRIRRPGIDSDSGWAGGPEHGALGEVPGGSMAALVPAGDTWPDPACVQRPPRLLWVGGACRSGQHSRRLISLSYEFITLFPERIYVTDRFPSLMAV